MARPARFIERVFFRRILGESGRILSAALHGLAVSHGLYVAARLLGFLGYPL